MTADGQPAPLGPGNLVVVTGTGTEVGKTWVSAHLLRELARRGLRCAARKPAQSFAEDDTEPRDAEVLAEATREDPTVVCPPHRNYSVAMAPPMAADALGADPITAADLLAELRVSWPDPLPDIAVVELAGGVRSPIATDADCGEFAAMLEPSTLVVVADAGLGTINAVLGSLDSLRATGAVPARGQPGSDEAIVYLNRYDGALDLHRRNRAWLTEVCGGPIPSTPGELADLLVGPSRSVPGS